MRCPKCGTENPDDAQICSTCGYVPKSDAADKPTAKPKTSRLAIASLVLSIFGLFTFLITALISIALGITSLCRIKKQKAELKGKYIAVTGIAVSLVCILVFVAAFVLWGLDTPPIPDDYTTADLRSAPPDCEKSYELLKTLVGSKQDSGEASAIGLSEQDINTIDQVDEVIKEGDFSKITKVLEANADNIQQAWKNAQKARDIISELNTFPEIADLTEPTVNTDIINFMNLIKLAHLFQAYFYLKIQQDDVEPAIRELTEFDSVVRKFSINARPLIAKLACCVCLTTNITTANAIVNSSSVSQETVGFLAEHFPPLTNEHTSLQNPVLSEYLILKDVDTRVLDKRRMGYNLFLKSNSTLRLYRNLCDDWIATLQGHENSKRLPLSVWPSRFLDRLPVSIGSRGRVPWYYMCYNPVGSMLIQMLTPGFESTLDKRDVIKVQDDLLQIVLNKRLGNEVSLKARAYSNEYIIDTEKKIIFSPGPDGKADTKDDIKLMINPEVLNFAD